MDNVVELQNYPALAAEKIAAELKDFTGGSKEKAISKFAAETLTHFCEESPAFAEVVYKTRRTLSDCCGEVMKGTGNYVSDIDVYRGIVRAYFPNADVKFLMNIEIKGAAPSEEEMAKLPEKPKPRPAKKKPVEKTPAPVKPGGSGVCPKCGWPSNYRADWVKAEVMHKAKICIASKVEHQLQELAESLGL